MRSMVLGGLFLACTTVSASAQEAAPHGALPIRDEAPVVVSGALPGPGMWKVSGNGHVMYVLGTVSPLPKGLEWISRDVEQVLAQAGEVVLSPSYQVDADVGFFGKLALLPSLIGVRRNPDDKKLQDVVPAQSYARWLVLKQRYIGRDGDVEKMRPIFAANELYQAAIEDSGLTGRRIVWPVIKDAIDEHGIKLTEPKVKVAIKDPKAALKEFRAGAVGDLDCFDKMLANLETDVARMAQRANAWAVGDVEALRTLPLGDQYQACQDALMQTSVAQKRGIGNAEAEVRQAWLVAAESALANNTVSFAMLPMSELLKGDGYLSLLQAKGYTVEAP
ncbi:TraB/GumN family protein [Lysobacter solisilvae (ex Woo and Kim 2020)]|uniref:TraB/GumN family protein n=1 Tax=Agrilutibacter terrestris TaxID=2865112 RepID=A0A7H0FYE2_9GAMM|nr:TraB/GumN family protein [Lysobacter terrestris]QNP41058.1 TraB/GumN family protein [Lysobacter terrestris]